MEKIKNRLNKIINEIESDTKVILIEENENEADDYVSTTFKLLQNGEFEKYVNCVLNQCEKNSQYYTEEMKDLCIGLYGMALFSYAMKLNILNEVAGIEDMGPRHPIFNTDRKTTIDRKKLIKALRKYDEEKDVDYLVRTIKYLTKLNFYDYELPLTPYDATIEVSNAIKIHDELVKKYSLDGSEVLNTRNPFDKF